MGEVRGEIMQVLFLGRRVQILWHFTTISTWNAAVENHGAHLLGADVISQRAV